jgi:clan AA aspartic protease (TIGR02281 family)
MESIQTPTLFRATLSGKQMRISATRACLVFAALLVACSFLTAAPAVAASCQVVQARVPSEVEREYLRGEYDKAAASYRQQLEQHPKDVFLTVQLSEVLLRQQAAAQAEELVKNAVAVHPHSALLETALAEIQYRQGAPWDALESARAALKDDLCYARAHLILARLSRLSSMYAAERDELRLAHQLDPHDPAIHSEWIETLSRREKIAELEAYLATPTGDDADDIRRLHLYLDALKKRSEEPSKSCRLVSSTVSTEIPFIYLMGEDAHIRAFGLDVKLNNRAARLQIDTGASGLVISRTVAQRAGLAMFSKTESSGIGTEGAKSAYMAYADTIRIGAMEFHDCAVKVLDSRNVVDSEGLIGMDVFDKFLVTLDYPMRKLALAPLPPRPNEGAAAAPSLNTDDTDDEDAPKSDAPGNTQNSATPSTTSRTPQNRYLAPEMKDYFPVYRVGHELLMPTMLNKSAMKLFILDTGSFTTSISPEAAREVTKVRSDDRVTVKGISGKVAQVYSADKIIFRFANLAQEVDGVVAFDTSNISRHSGVEVSGLIGATTLSQVTMHIDYRDGLVKFEYDRNRGYR